LGEGEGKLVDVHTVLYIDVGSAGRLSCGSMTVSQDWERKTDSIYVYGVGRWGGLLGSNGIYHLYIYTIPDLRIGFMRSDLFFFFLSSKGGGGEGGGGIKV